MIYIKLGDDMDLAVTVNGPIYRGDNLSRKIIYLIPMQVGEVDMLTAVPYLTYVRADGVADIVRLDRQDAKYKEAYYQYTLPISCRITKCPGEVCTWLQIFSGSPSAPVIAKSGECLLYVEDSKNMDDYMCDHQVSALYAMQKEIDAGIENMTSALATKADGLDYDKNKRELTLKAGDTAIGNSVIVPSDDYADQISKDGDSTWDDMTSSGDDADQGGETWEQM